MFKIVIAVVLLAHGIGHVLGPLQVSKVADVNQSWNGDSWLLTGAVGQSITGAVGVALWTVAIVAFGVLAGVVMGWLPEAWWTPSRSWPQSCRWSACSSSRGIPGHQHDRCGHRGRGCPRRGPLVPLGSEQLPA